MSREIKEEDCEKYRKFRKLHKLSDDEGELFIDLIEQGMPYKTCEKTLLEARVKNEPKPEPEPEPEPVQVEEAKVE
tara:strand:+ start:125 stop:352 length:228 start_codon:yes stop_codon:yes gene_type:complete